MMNAYPELRNLTASVHAVKNCPLVSSAKIEFRAVDAASGRMRAVKTLSPSWPDPPQGERGREQRHHRSSAVHVQLDTGVLWCTH